MNNNSRPSRNPSPSVSGFVGSVVYPEILIIDCEAKLPNDSALVIPAHCCKVYPAPMLVTNHCGLERFALVSERLGSMLLYSSQFDIPSSSESSHLSSEFNGSKVQPESNKCQRANHISQPSGIPSPSLSASVGSPVASPSPNGSSGIPQSEIFLNRSVLNPSGISSPSRLIFPENKLSRILYSSQFTNASLSSIIPFWLISKPSPSGFSKASLPFNGLMPILDTVQTQEFLASQPSGKPSPSESTLFGSGSAQACADSEVTR